MGIKRDITERKLAEAAALRESQRRHQNLIHSLDAIVWEGEPTQLDVTYINPQVQRLLGYASEQWLNKEVTWRDIIHADDFEKVVHEYLENVKRVCNHSVEYRAWAANGRLMWIRDVVTVVMEGDRPVCRLRSHA